MSARAVFDENEHCTQAGWATHHGRGEVRCRWWRRSHVVPGVPASVRDYSRCPRCRAALKWFVVGQHRRGSYDKDVFDAYRSRSGVGS